MNEISRQQRQEIDIKKYNRAEHVLSERRMIMDNRKQQNKRELARIQKKQKKEQRRICKSSEGISPYNGIITRVNKSQCVVSTEGISLDCIINPQLAKDYKIKLEKGLIKESLVAPGDKVYVQNNIIRMIAPRTKSFARKATVQTFSQKTYRQILAANIDLVAVFMPIVHPDIEWGFIDNFMLSCFANNINSILVFNKIDLIDTQQLEQIKQKAAEYNWNVEKIFYTCAANKDGCAELKEYLMNRKTFMVGISGAGKSTFINYVNPCLNIQTGEVNQKTGRGNHTTAFSTLIPLMDDSYLIDSPGVQMFDQYGVTKDHLAEYIPSITEASCQCRFCDCKHINEDEEVCAVKQQVSSGAIKLLDYQRYINLNNRLR